MPAESQAVLRDSELTTTSSTNQQNLLSPRELGLILLLTGGAIAVHGYHPFVEDAEIYVPGINKLLNPALYPVNDVFFTSHASKTFFPNLIAWSVRTSHLSVDWVLLLGHFLCIFILLLGAWKLGCACFGTKRAGWGSAVLLGALLTIPVAGTALYIMDQYLNPRSFSTATSVWMLLAAIRRRFASAALLFVATALIHPLMAVFSLILVLILIWQKPKPASSATCGAAALIFPLSLFPPITDAYKQVLDRHSYFFLLRWQWYEWLGLIGPLIILWFTKNRARRHNLAILEQLASATIVFGLAFTFIALVLTGPRQFARFAELQPMRALLLVYIMLFVILGGATAEYILKNRSWRWFALFLPITAGMFYAQRDLFPTTQHLELPRSQSDNAWVQAFVWIRNNTPTDAYFALDPDHMRLSGEDQHGFRAIAERSMLADRVKDSGAVSMFPALAETWLRQVNSQDKWDRFRLEDFRRLHTGYGVDWVVLRKPGVPGLECPYDNAYLLVCRIGEPHPPEGTK
jgi:hypothetical protein